SVHDRRCRADGGALADTPNTERVQIGRDLRVARLKRGEVGGVRHCVVVESANQRLAAAPVYQRLHESLTDTLCRPAMHLTVDEQRVDDSAAVVHHDVTQQCNVSCFDVHFDHGNMRTVAKEHVLWVEKVALIEAGRHAERQVVAEVRLARDISEGYDFGTTWHHCKLEAAAPLEDCA